MPANSVLAITDIDVTSQLKPITSDYKFLSTNETEEIVARADIDDVKRYCIQELEDRVETLEFTPPEIVYFDVSEPLLLEKGESRETLTLSWEFLGTKKDVYQEILQKNTNYPIFSTTDTEVTSAQISSGPYRANSNNSSWTLEITSYFRNVGYTTNTSISIEFMNGIYWGSSTEEWYTSNTETIIDNRILSLPGKTLSRDKHRTITYQCYPGEYIYYAYPAELGDISLAIVNGANFSDFTKYIVQLTNTNQFTELYYLYKFNKKQHGRNIRVEWF